MAWSQGNILYRFPFKSLNDTSCRIDVYVRDYSGEMVFTLPAADNPFFYEEEEDSDILNTVLRYRTGYIRVIEEENSPITSIYPSQPFDRYVEVYYGNDLVFNGFIQVQDFSRELTPTPRIIELAVVSPLGLFDKKTFSNTLYQPVSEVSLGDLLNVILSGSTYSYVYLPKKYGYPNTVNLSMKVSTLVATPWNTDYHYSMNISPQNKVMKGETYAFIIEAICKAFGWICHDTPDSLIFTAFDYEDEYYYFPVGHIGETGYNTDANISASAVNLLDYFTEADNQANETTLQPDTGIEISYEGEYGDRTFDFAHTFVPDTDPVAIMPSFVPVGDVFPNHAEIFSMCSLMPISFLFETDLNAQPSFDNNDKINIGNYPVAWNGMKGVMISVSGSYQSDISLFWIRFYLRKRSGQKFSLSYDIRVRKDGAIGGLAQHPDEDLEYYIYNELDYSHDHYIQATFKYRYGAQSSMYPALTANALIFISNIKLEICEQGIPYEEYRYKPPTDSDTISPDGDVDTLQSGNVNPAISREISMPISMYRLNDNLIGTSVRQTKVTLYPYMFQPRKELTERFRLVNAPTFPHIRLFTYMNKKWRIIAQRFDPWNDEMKLTLQHSPVL